MAVNTHQAAGRGERPAHSAYRPAGRAFRVRESVRKTPPGKAPCSARNSPRVPEQHVAEMWIRLCSEARTFPLAGGGGAEVLETGVRNMHDGPDFLGALLLVDGVARRGDIEIHTREEDWFRHGHAGDRRYEGVILHVALYPAPVSPLPIGAATVILSQVLRRPLRQAWSEVLQDSGSRSAPHCVALDAPPGAALTAVMALLCASERFARKVASAEARLLEFRKLGNRREALEGVFHEMSARAFGYGGNEKSFEKLARTLPLRKLAESCGSDAVRIAEVLSEHCARSAYEWNSGSVRPVNSVKIRAAQLASWASALIGGKLLRELELLMLENPPSPQRLLRLIARRCADPRLRVEAPGTSRCAEIVINVLAPFFAASARSENREKLLRSAVALYHGFPIAPGNRKTRRLQPLFGRGVALSSGMQQGLIELHDKYCETSACSDCLIWARFPLGGCP